MRFKSFISRCESHVLREKVKFFSSLGIIKISGIYKLSIYINIALLKLFTESLKLWLFMKFCNLGDQSQFETRHWMNTNNTPWLGFLIMGTHGILAFLMDYVNMSFSFFETRYHKNSFMSFNVCKDISLVRLHKVHCQYKGSCILYVYPGDEQNKQKFSQFEVTSANVHKNTMPV